MPKNGAAQRAVQQGALAVVVHHRHGDPQLMEWIDAVDLEQVSDFDRANIFEARRAYDRATKIPASLAQALAAAGSEGHGIWANARAEKDFSLYAPTLKKMIELKREESACLTPPGGDPYDALLDEFEPGMRVAELAPLLHGLRAPLVALKQQLGEWGPAPKLDGPFEDGAQLALAREIAVDLGYDFDAGRLDTVTHPFCLGTAGDVRITTRVNADDPFECLYSTIHEVGHALYAQGAGDPFLPAGDYCSMGVHESQSRFWENQICRSRPFMEFLYPKMRAHFGEFGCFSPDELYRAANHVQSGYIRTEADEVHYNLHILLRFDLERALISGDLQVDDLEAAWNDRFAQDFGNKVPDPSLGVLQDVHWAFGGFGYFPTYSLGNIYAGCLDAAMQREMPDRATRVARGEVADILAWLRSKIHARGRLLPAPALIEEATGGAPTADDLTLYLENKFVGMS